MLKRGKGRISDWLVANCSLSTSAAGLLEERLCKECLIESVGSLFRCASTTPDVLDKLNLPRTLLMILNDQLGILNCKPLSDVTVSEISTALANVLPDSPEYSASFFKSRVTGFVLSQITTCKELMDWGIKSKKDAMVLLGHLSAWKTSGVPRHYTRVVTTTGHNKHEIEKREAAEPSPMVISYCFQHSTSTIPYCFKSSFTVVSPQATEK